MHAPPQITTCVLMLQRPTRAFLGSKQPAVENHAFLTAAADPVSLSPLLHILPEVYRQSIPADYLHLLWISEEYVQDFIKHLKD